MAKRQIRLRTDDGRDVGVRDGAELQRMALRWSYVARNRRRWKTGDRTVELGDQVRAGLARVGVGTAELETLGAANVIEVSVPFVREDQGWAGRILPWEFLLSKATRGYRQQPLVIVRHLDGGRPARRGRTVPKSFDIVECAPGLRDRFSFDSERRFVGLALEGLEELEPVFDPSLSELRRQLVRDEPDVVHVTGLDNHQARELLGIDEPEGVAQRDGLPFTCPGSVAPELVDAERSGGCFTDAARRPILVAFNVYNSAARLAPLTVASGAGAAIGFQDTFDDGLAEHFFVDLYDAWKIADWDLLTGFREAWERLESRGRDLGGTGIVLWSRRSFFDKRREPLGATRDRVRERIEARRSTRLTVDEVVSGVQVRVECLPDLNYSLLHNKRPLFRSFEITKSVPAEVRILVEVQLHVGAESFPFKAAFDLQRSITHIDRHVHVSLTSKFMRTAAEKTRTSLYVDVSHQDRCIHRNTFRVSLLPIDEWRDNELDRWWLPSFVLPRDVAVARIVGQAQRYLVALADHAGAGFDGYQAVHDAVGDFASVDLQVRAIWWSLAQELRLSYINPPPSYSMASQRLRTPSQIVDRGHGTCIDLTLLLVACLEYIGVYPVIFLFKGHACAGYWRSAGLYEEAFNRFGSVTGSNPAMAEASTTASAESYVLLPDAFAEIRGWIRSGSLVPVECVALTDHGACREALEQGQENLRRKGDFDSMLDLTRAREADLTPLPLMGEPS